MIQLNNFGIPISRSLYKVKLCHLLNPVSSTENELTTRNYLAVTGNLKTKLLGSFGICILVQSKVPVDNYKKDQYLNYGIFYEF